jgi:hypothetical protein
MVASRPEKRTPNERPEVHCRVAGTAQKQNDAVASLDEEMEMTPVERLKQNPKTTTVGIILGAAASAAASGAIPEPYGQLTLLASSLLANIVLLFAKD